MTREPAMEPGPRLRLGLGPGPRPRPEMRPQLGLRMGWREVTSSVGQLHCADPQRHPEKARKLLVMVSATQLEVSELGSEPRPI